VGEFVVVEERLGLEVFLGFLEVGGFFLDEFFEEAEDLEVGVFGEFSVVEISEDFFEDEAVCGRVDFVGEMLVRVAEGDE